MCIRDRRYKSRTVAKSEARPSLLGVISDATTAQKARLPEADREGLHASIVWGKTSKA